jgi:hypothetical protein
MDQFHSASLEKMAIRPAMLVLPNGKGVGVVEAKDFAPSSGLTTVAWDRTIEHVYRLEGPLTVNYD